MFQNAAEILTLSVSAAVQWLFYRKRLPKDFTPERILVVKLDHLGDVLLATPVCSNLRQAYPNAELHVLAGGWSRVVLEHHPDVDKVFEYNSPFFCRSGKPTRFREAVQLYRELRHQKYDLLIELRGDWRIAGFSLLRVTPKRLARATLQVANRIGFRKFSGIHETTRNLDVLRQAGIATPMQTPTFKVPEAAEKSASDFLAVHRINRAYPLIVIHPGSPVTLKRWLPERYAEVADWLIARKRAQIVFVGVQDEIPIVNAIQARMQGESINIAGETSVIELASILQLATVFIGNDSGPMHLAAAVGTWTIGLYGPSESARFGPVGAWCETVRGTTPCPPCSGELCRFGTAECMQQIQVSDVLQRLTEMDCLDNSPHSSLI